MALALSITPSRTALFHRAERPFVQSVAPLRSAPVADNSRPNPQLSRKAQKRIRDAINWLCYLSQRRNVQGPNGRTIRNFQISFITLTLPTKQMHTHKEITSRCLNRFLTVARKKFGIRNYVWKAELQRNGNIHYHLTTDRYIHYMAIRREWNAAISKLGYIQDYHDTFCRLDRDEYHYWRSHQGATDRKANDRAHEYGRTTDWMSPNTTDVKKVDNVRQLAAYLAKYLTKPPVAGDVTGIIADSARELTGRLWFLSRSLSRLKASIVMYATDTSRVLRFLSELKTVASRTFQWVRLFWYDVKDLPETLREWFRQELMSHAIMSGYPFPAGIPEN